MNNAIAKKLGRSFLAPHIANLEPPDPVYETSNDPNNSNKRRKKRGLPPGLTKAEERVLMKVRKRSRCLDRGFSLCGFRFGWTAIIGFIPVLGDIISAALSYYLVIRQTRKCDLPDSLVQRMLFNQAVATSVGLIPFIGDLIMAAWKVNSRNAALFEDFLILRAQRTNPPTIPPNVVPNSETTRLINNNNKTPTVVLINGESGSAASGSAQQEAEGCSTAVDTPKVASTESPKQQKKKWFGRN
ncbi:hypothetical protein BY996DRAFT_2571750 [Phakopsora pachyrhizi]|uniref:Uncharacterized protein n=1 Tax=Phakopsora pachyrhizi TaxID=170000 RepID=A0AAV0APX9_PHAPC|nr:hypothetical protein BY996DRAFT_2571750 [Phakopsora pachyrhizi]CAH7670489.1 hypothetical protein PPACK8108_LOCUS5213 [Phakopsora pachyrhizi]